MASVPQSVHIEHLVQCKVPRGGEVPRVVIIHCTRSGQEWSDTQELYQTIVLFTSPGSTRSYNLLVHTDGMWLYCVEWDLGSCGATYLNEEAIQVGMVQAREFDGFTDIQIHRTAEAVRWICNTFGIPKTRIFDETGSGIIGHEDTAQGQVQGKTDPGALFPWDTFMELVNSEGPPPSPDEAVGSIVPVLVVVGGLSAAYLLYRQMAKREKRRGE